MIAWKSAISRPFPYTPLGVKLANLLAGGIVSYQRKCRNRRQVANGRGQLPAIARAKNKPFAALQVKETTVGERPVPSIPSPAFWGNWKLAGHFESREISTWAILRPDLGLSVSSLLSSALRRGKEFFEAIEWSPQSQDCVLACTISMLHVKAGPLDAGFEDAHSVCREAGTRGAPGAALQQPDPGNATIVLLFPRQGQ